MTYEIEIAGKDLLIDYDYSPGERSVTSGPADNWYQGADPEVTVCSVIDQEGNSMMDFYYDHQDMIDEQLIDHAESDAADRRGEAREDY